MKAFCNYCLIFCLFLGTIPSSYGQNNVLIQNINPLAKDLKHYLTKSNDTLVLENKDKIFSVELYNQEFNLLVKTSSPVVKVPLQNTPEGRLVVEVFVSNKRIILNLLRHKSYPKTLYGVTTLATDDIEAENVSSRPKKSTSVYKPKKKKPVKKPVTAQSEKKTTRTKRPNTDHRSKTETNMVESGRAQSYWIMQKINKGYGSERITRFGDIKVVNFLISQNKIDTQIKSGKGNELIIWEVYDTNAFKKKIYRNYDYVFKVESSECFNVEPFYRTTL